MNNINEIREKTSRYLASSYSVTFANTVQAMINKSYIIDFGIIKDIPANGIVTVETSVAKDTKDIVIITCILAGLSSDNLTVNVKPIIGDKVIVLYPRRYDNKMFDVESKEPIIKDTASGYNLFSGIAILANQCKTKSYKNIVTVNEGTVDIKLGYNKDEDKNYFNLSTTKEGDINFNNPKANFSIDKDGNITLKAGEKEGTTVTLKADKSSSITNGNANINISANNDIKVENKASSISVSNTGNITIDAKAGLLSIKNTAQDLGKLIDEFVGIMQALKTPSYVISPDNVAQLVALRVKLSTLFNTGFEPPEPPPEPPKKPPKKQ